MTRIRSLGASEKAVLEFLRAHPNSRSREVGLSLYTIVRTKRGNRETTRKIVVIQSEWASKLLQKLKKRGLVQYNNSIHPRWSVKPNGEIGN